MLNEKKQNEIRVIAKYLRQECTDFESFTFAMEELFKGKAEVLPDNQGQLNIYTGHTFGMHTSDITCMETKEFLDS